MPFRLVNGYLDCSDRRPKEQCKRSNEGVTVYHSTGRKIAEDFYRLYWPILNKYPVYKDEGNLKCVSKQQRSVTSFEHDSNALTTCHDVRFRVKLNSQLMTSYNMWVLIPEFITEL